MNAVHGNYDVNDSGDYDQLSIAGVDFGENYDRSENVKPNYLIGDNFMYGADYQQLGEDYNQLGIVPTGMGEDYNQLGIVPQGLGHSDYWQLGEVPYGMRGIPQGMGTDYNQLGQLEMLTKKVKLPLINMEVPMWGMILGGMAAFYMINKKMRLAKLPF